MPTRELKSLLETYDFLDGALKRHGPAMSPEHRRELEHEQATVIRRMLTHNSSNPAVLLPQIKALLACLQNHPHDGELTSFVADACQRHIATLSEAILPVEPTPAAVREPTKVRADRKGRINPEALRLLDVSSDRIAVIGGDYRYQHSNLANARFHACEPMALVRRPLWETTSTTFFATVTKPVFDRCLAGHSATFTASHPGRDPSELFEIQLDPIRDPKNRVTAAFCIARRVVAPTAMS